mmetsp:Transcript_16646/g.29629  ORF Transcript_16646/g.29629 Transcript_16646/m.29629 type:complete len:139 (-) Transcript_16646:37-453(-)
MVLRSELLRLNSGSSSRINRMLSEARGPPHGLGSLQTGEVDIRAFSGKNCGAASCAVASGTDLEGRVESGDCSSSAPLADRLGDRLDSFPGEKTHGCGSPSDSLPNEASDVSATCSDIVTLDIGIGTSTSNKDAMVWH